MNYTHPDERTITRRLADNVRARRAVLNLTARETAKLAGLPYHSWTQAELGDHATRAPRLLLIARVLRTTTDALLTETPAGAGTPTPTTPP